MTDPTILAGLAEIAQEVAGVEPEKVVPEAAFLDDLDLDSLTMVEVVVAAEQKFDVRIPDDDVAGLVTVGDAVDYIEKARTAAGRSA
jgi:acyl carrier protein